MLVDKGLSKRVQSNVIVQVCWFLVCSCRPGVIWAVVAITLRRFIRFHMLCVMEEDYILEKINIRSCFFFHSKTVC